MVMAGRIGWQQVQESAAAAAHIVLIEHMAFELMVALIAERMEERAAELMAAQLVELAVGDSKVELSRFRTAIW